jgi:predicted phosphodiesterase
VPGDLPLSARCVAALYDIHANLPALDAVLDEVRRADVDRIVIGGDVVPGPFPRETLARLFGLETPVHFIHGNGELAVLAQIAAGDSGVVTYWGTTSGEPLPAPLRDVLRWSGRQLSPEDLGALRTWPGTLRIAVDGLGDVLFCHGTPRSETECFTRLTPAALLQDAFDGVAERIVICGHTHMPFDREIGGRRVVNAGSVGMPFGRPGADWLLLGPDVEPRHTEYDRGAAASRIRITGYPQAVEFAAQYVLQSPPEAAMLEAFTHASFR